MGLRVVVWAIFDHSLEDRQHAGENLEPQVLLVAQAVCPALDDADLVIELLDEAERDPVLGSAAMPSQ